MTTPYLLVRKDADRSKKYKTIATTQVFNYLLTNWAKKTFNRRRPDGSNTYSFWSGHSSNSAVSAALICKIDSKYCAPSLLLAGTVGYLRIAARKHYLTDVLTGLTIGYMNGKVFPKLVVNF